MINAHEAKRKTLINSECKGIMTEIERSIKNAVKNGFYVAKIPMHQFNSTPRKAVIDALCEELTSLGYNVDYIEPTTLAPGFHPEAYRYNYCSYLKIDWSLEEEECND